MIFAKKVLEWTLEVGFFLIFVIFVFHGPWIMHWVFWKVLIVKAITPSILAAGPDDLTTRTPSGWNPDVWRHKHISSLGSTGLMLVVPMSDCFYRQINYRSPYKRWIAKEDITVYKKRRKLSGWYMPMKILWLYIRLVTIVLCIVTWLEFVCNRRM